MTGPVEYLVVGFPDGNVNDDIAPELAKLVDNQTIGILDIVFLAKDAAGDVASWSSMSWTSSLVSARLTPR